MPGLSLDGLASGLDTQSIIAQLMQVESRPMQLLQQKKSQLQQLQGVWKDINSRLLSLQGKAETLKTAKGFNPVKASSTDASAVSVSATSAAYVGSYQVSVTQLATAQIVASDRTFGDLTTAQGLAGSFTINGKTVTLEATDSLAKIKDRINNTADIGVSATVVQTAPGAYQLVLSGLKTGTANAISYDDSAAGVLESLQLVVADPDTGAKGLHTVQTATNALATINGLSVESSTNSVTDAIPGATINLYKGSTSKDASGNPIPVTTTVNVVKDTDSVVATIKSLVDQYNSLSAYIGKQQAYDKEEKTGGPLLGDSTATGILQTLRYQLTDQISSLSGGLSLPGEIGISTGKWNTDDFGKLVVDDAKLRQALNDNFDGVVAMFTATDGIATRIAKYTQEFTKPVTGIIPGKDTALVSQVNDLTSRIEDMNTRLTQREERYRAQFTALEAALSKLKSQGSWLTAQLGSMPSVQ